VDPWLAAKATCALGIGRQGQEVAPDRSRVDRADGFASNWSEILCVLAMRKPGSSMMKHLLLPLAMLLSGGLMAQVVSPAAIVRIELGYGEGAAEEMRLNTHYRYLSTQFYYARSFEVLHQGEYRWPTEEEIALIDIAMMEAQRDEVTAVVVEHPGTGAQLRLMGREEFGFMLLALLPEEDIVAFEEQKDRWLQAPTKSSP
jgi:hypothetical protein